MSAALALTPAPPRRREPASEGPSARFAVYPEHGEPPEVERLSEVDPASLVEVTFTRAAAAARVPAVALREVVENLVHAQFAGALVSVLDRGWTVRVSDRGPGIPDPARAMLPGFTTADADARRVIRGVGCGLPLVARLMADAGGSLHLEENLRGGTVVTLAGPVPAQSPQAGPRVPPPSETARRLLALLVELAPAAPQRLAAELDLPLAECGRELVLLEHRGLVARAATGERTLAESGSALLATLF
jgi:anti-sigma regulatory factor (Ser/Thr protein kinase)